MSLREGTGPRGRRGERPRLLLVGPRIIDGDVVGGTQVQFEQILRALRDRAKIQVTVVSTARPLADRTRLGKLLLDARTFLATMAAMWREAPAADLVAWYVSGRAAMLGGSFVWLVCAVRGSPLCICFFGGDFDTRLASSPAACRFVAGRTFLRAALLLCETRRLSAALGAGFRAAWLPNTRDMPPRRRPYGSCCRRLLFLSVLDPRKGLPELIAAARRFPPSVRLSVFGPPTGGFDVGSIGAAPNVTYRGVVAPDRVPAVMEEHDALVLPTRHATEGYPGVVIEAFQMGLPVVSTRCGGLRELVTDGRDGLCISAGSVDSLVDAVVRLCSDDRLFRRLRTGALETGGRYRNDRAAAVLEGFCRRAVAGPGRTWRAGGSVSGEA